MIVVRRWQDLGGRFPRPVVALGKFDGVHRGHQKLIGDVVRLARARGVASMVVTFDIHPHSLLRPHKVPPALTTPEEKTELIGRSGADVLLYLSFTPSFARLSAWEFARTYLAKRIDAGTIMSGKNFRFGRNRTGDVEKLGRWGEKLGFEFRVVPQITICGVPASSTKVRREVAAGEMEQAACLLGRPYSIDGVVAPGAGRGVSLGAPTANLPLPTKLLPPDGVYLVRAAVDEGEPAPGIANLGFSPTFGSGERRLEVHFLEGAGNLYGRHLRVLFARHLRPERAFPSAGELARQIGEDIAAAKAYFKAVR